jgi:hypothetical protein
VNLVKLITPALRYGAGGFLVATGQDDTKFIAAKAGRHIFGPDQAADGGANLAQ